MGCFLISLVAFPNPAVCNFADCCHAGAWLICSSKYGAAFDSRDFHLLHLFSVEPIRSVLNAILMDRHSVPVGTKLVSITEQMRSHDQANPFLTALQDCQGNINSCPDHTLL